MRLSTSILTALALAFASHSVDARHLRHGGHEPSDISLTIKRPDDRWGPVDEIKAPEAFDTPHDSKLREPARVEALAAVDVAVETPARPIKTYKGSTGTCIGPLCGLSLFFALVWVTFAVCVVVVYVVDRRFNPWTEAEAAHDADKPRKRRMSGGVDVVRQATAYYQSVSTSMHATLLRRRALA